jgi:hypothetical protein
MKSNSSFSSFNRPVVASPAPDASNGLTGTGTVASQIALVVYICDVLCIINDIMKQAICSTPLAIKLTNYT